MIKLLRSILNLDTIDALKAQVARLEQSLEAQDEHIKQVEADNREYKGYKLQYQVAKMYLEDDAAIDEMLEVAAQHEQKKKELLDYQRKLSEDSNTTSIDDGNLLIEISLARDISAQRGGHSQLSGLRQQQQSCFGAAGGLGLAGMAGMAQSGRLF